MYPQHQLPFINIHQPCYSSSNPFLLSFPTQASDSAALHQYGAVSVANSTLYLSNLAPSYGAQTTSDPQNWIAKHADPITYDPAVGSSHATSAVSTSLPAAWNGTWSNQFSGNDTTITLPNRTKVTNPMRCEVCKVDCNSRDAYEKHISGKKHKRNLQVQTNPTNTTLSGSSYASVQSLTSSNQGQVLTGSVGKELEFKKRKLLNGGAVTDSVKVCTVCNVVCNSQEVFSKHLAGKKHAAQVGLMSNTGVGPYIAAFKRQGIGPWKKAPKKIKFVHSSWCEVCKINCNSRDVYIVHLSGKKHLKNREKLSKPKIDTGSGATAGKVMTCSANLIIGPQEKTGTDKPKSQKTPEMDIEAKKLKIVEAGTAASAVRSCTLCNVVCNSETVYNAHLAGHKHAAMVRKQAESRGATAS